MAIKIAPGARVGLKNVAIVGFDTGIEGGPGSSVRAENVIFSDVRQPWNMTDAGPSAISGTRIFDDPKLRNKKKKQQINRPPPGAALPTFCPKCKSIFASRNYVLDGKSWDMRNNQEQCPECGYEAAEVAEGVFNLTRETVEILNAPDFTHSMLAAINAITERVLSGDLAADAATYEISEVSKPFATLWRKAIEHGSSAIMLVATVAAAYFGYESKLLAQKQVEIGLEQVRLQKESNTDNILSNILQSMNDKRFTSVGVKDEPAQPKIRGGKPTYPANGQPPAKAGTSEFKPNRKPKAREVRRQTRQDHRRLMKGRPHCAAPKRS